MKTVFLIAGRLKSTRLPDKLRLPLAGRSTIAHLLDRAKAAPHVDQVVICTSTNPQDDPLAEIAANEGVECFRGDEDDVIRRLRDAARACEADYVLHITADCPLVDPAYAGRIVDAYGRTGADLIRALDLPHGAFSYGMTPAALDRVMAIKDEANTEVWGRYFTDTDAFAVHDLDVDSRHRRPNIRLTIDYPEDLQLLEAVFAALYRPGALFSLDEVIAFLDAHPDVASINRECADKYRRRWSRQAAAIRLKPRYEVRRAAVVGCGSIGQRHLRNLRSLGITDIVALRGRPGHLRRLDPALGVREVEGWDALAATKPDIAIVSNPSSLHLDTARRLTSCVRGLFIEKPLAASLDGVGAWLGELRQRKVVSFVGHVLAFHPAIVALRERLQRDTLGDPLVLQCQIGQFLPDWHPGEDYRQVYYGRADLGGGVVRSLMHELHLATTLLGAPVRVAALIDAAPQLEVDVDAIANLMVQHEGGAVSQIHLDYLQRPLRRAGTLVCARGSLTYDLVASRLIECGSDGREARVEWCDAAFDWNRSFVDELATFIQYVREGRVRHEHDAWSAVPSLALADAAFASAQSGAFVAVASGVPS